MTQYGKDKFARCMAQRQTQIGEMKGNIRVRGVCIAGGRGDLRFELTNQPPSCKL